MQWHLYIILHSKDNCCLILIFNYICLTLQPLLLCFLKEFLDAQLLPQSTQCFPPSISHLIIWISLTAFNYKFSQISHKLFLHIIVTLEILANSLVYPERIHRGIEWTSVFETSVLCVSVCSFGQIFSFSSFNLLFLYSTVQKSVVQYRYLFCASILYTLQYIKRCDSILAT